MVILKPLKFPLQIYFTYFYIRTLNIDLPIIIDHLKFHKLQKKKT